MNHAAAHPIADNLLNQLTLEEKLSLLEGYHSWQTAPIPRLAVPSLFLTDGPHGVRKVRQAEGAFDIADNLTSSSFPTSSGVASSWNVANARAIAAAIAREARRLDVHVVLAPGVNIVRDPRLGRAFEYYSEDPLISGEFGAAFVAGLQGEGVGACVKHFAANSNENYRFVGDSVVDERALNEIYLRAFERIVKQAAPAAVMSAYNKLNGTFCSEHKELLTGVLRERWGFDGVVMTDWGATHDRAAGVAAGLDLDMPGGVDHNRQTLRHALESGQLDMADVDAAARNVLNLVARYHDAPHPARDGVVDHDQLARDVAVDSAVLLKNDGVLPLQPTGPRLLVVGELFEHLRFQGAGSSLVTPPRVVSAKDAFDRRGINYRYAPGYRSLDLDRSPELEAAALAAVRDADVVLFFGGLSDFEESEGFDRDRLTLSTAQSALLQALTATGVPVVLVLHAGSPVEIPALGQLAAVLHMHLPGMQGGEATAALLLGEATPSGRLAVSWPKRLTDVSDFADYDRTEVARYYESIYVGYRYYDAAGTELQFPFGYGLSYTTFAYRDLTVAVSDDVVSAEVTVSNTGARDGAEVVQLYVRNNRGTVFKADKELRAFTKVFLASGQSARVTLEFPLTDLAYWDVCAHDWRLENGAYQVMVAADAAHEVLTAPLQVDCGQPSRSPYPAQVDGDYATPPARSPASFPALVGQAIPQPQRSGPLSMETRLEDARRTLVGGLFYRTVVGMMHRDFTKARALPESVEKDARVKNAYFTYRLMPTNSLRSMAMASGGRFPYHVAKGVSEMAEGKVLRGLRTVVTKRTVK